MRIGVLTSSRADFGIYLPLLKRLAADDHFDLSIIVFGAHLSPSHGYTVEQVLSEGFDVSYRIETMPADDTPMAISTAMGMTLVKFAEFWDSHKAHFDLVFCLGDRYEMFSAVTAGIPFQIVFAHLHGGETTLGAIDNVFRHAITLASTYHFVSTSDAAQRVAQIAGSEENVYCIGALSLDNLEDAVFFSAEEFQKRWGIDLAKDTILTTFHPETVAYEQNEYFAQELIKAIASLSNYQVLITMPNADTAGNVIRNALISSFSNSDRVFLVENLGTKGYFTVMKHCAFLLGNTSSGIIEAASFGKYVINLGDRQKGRSAGPNVITVPIVSAAICQAVQYVETAAMLSVDNIYYSGGAANKIVALLKDFPA
ncbi:UDP-N-acetylglucosamine 2-epimerase [Mucilaginibacter sp. L3T2-6]|uniref:UDP-N-acetylglucosamine 2-epimerase n=1 Tax=Mucilaginibacter sp. L3T2-6 TaxID=3062491 RepID=UPI002676F20A|nr:UDP-N-acetylglucosamine 2-epimerase [Mucilaginibacter sp. L3T2-6]MDO3642479.1 UDP-N-acetylglucosamine 2-epimerase [Mucilaginibacter sp. L3T2-6]MDV6215125.1 UDP-N-acetylglucosamine 2-epimerase [Mucilaginibacter sp. L3T2-6]